MAKTDSKLESDLRENQKIIEQLNIRATKHDLERENWKNEIAKLRQANSKLETELDETRKIIEQLKTKNEFERKEFKNKTTKMEHRIKKLEEKLKNERERNRILNKEEKGPSKREKKLEKLKNELGEKRGVGHFFGNDKVVFREEMKEKEIEQVLRLLQLGEKKINLKKIEFQFKPLKMDFLTRSFASLFKLRHIY